MKASESSESLPEKHIPMDQRKPVRNKILNGILMVLIVPPFIGLLMYGSFQGFKFVRADYFTLSLSLILIALYFILQSVFAMINNHYYIPKVKKSAQRLPEIAIQVIGRNEKPEIFYSTLKRLRDQTYPKDLVKKIVLCIDGNVREGKTMIEVFKDVFPNTQQINLGEKLSNLSEAERESLVNKYRATEYLIVTQPHGGRREIKYTAFNFSSNCSEYVLHCDSDTLLEPDALENLARTAAGYNAKYPDKLPCGGVVGEIKINNVLNYLALQMEISYWYAFNAGRASQSLFKCVTTISGAMGLFHSQSIKRVAQNYCKQTFFGIKCTYGEDRHLSSGLIELDHGILFDCNAIAFTETPRHMNDLMVQQARWYKGFYRQSMVFLPEILNYSWYSVLVLAYSFFIPFLALITIFTALLHLDQLVFFMIYVFIVTFLMSLRGVVRHCRFRFFHSLLHPLFFFLFLLPIKTLALVYCICPDWKQKKAKYFQTIVPAYIWMAAAIGVFIGIGLVYNIVVRGERLNRWMSVAIFIELGILLLLVIHWLTWGLFIYVPDNRQKLINMYSYNEVPRESALNLYSKEGKISTSVSALSSA